jgi:hypothetical protein
MATLNDDCQISLTHADVNGGLPTGFMLVRETAIAAQRSALELTTGTYTEETKLFASIVCEDYQTLPNGGRDTRTRAQVYAALVAYLTQRSGLQVETPVGLYVGMYCVNHLATETHYPGYSVIVCTFNNLNAAFAPADPVGYANSHWYREDLTPAEPNYLTWGTSYWRSL